MRYSPKSKLLKRNLKLRELKYFIEGEDTDRPLMEVISAIFIGAVLAFLMILLMLAFLTLLL